ncbi:MAG TPA: DUF3617 family protein [Gammaproteobacteria bacterium]
MKANTVRNTLLYLTTLGLLLPGMSALAEEGELWQTEVKVEMPGMPMAIPPQTASTCQPKGRSSEEMSIPKDASCKTTDFKKSGNKTSFKVACNGKDNSMTGSGEVETLGSDSYRGKMHMVMDAGGQRMEMTQNFTSKRLGKCDYQARN